jgi:putative ABC transport system permease protein
MGKEYAILVVIAACFGTPAGWLLMSWWLESYAYPVEMGYMTFVFASLACFAISMITISYHSFKVAANDPVKSLRYE